MCGEVSKMPYGLGMGWTLSKDGGHVEMLKGDEYVEMTVIGIH